MSARVMSSLLGALLAPAAIALAGCGHSAPPPPCLGEACRQWPHVDLRFFRNQGPPRGRAYTGALCVQVSFDCPEEGRHQVWVEPEAPRCDTYLNDDGSPEWLRVQQGRLSIPWPARCQGQTVEMYVTAQPNFATCTAVNNHLITVDRDALDAALVFDCR